MIVGGIVATGVTTEVKSFDLSTRQWTILQPLTYARRSHDCIHFKKTDGLEAVAVAGGITIAGCKLASVEIYDVAANTWSPGPDLPVPNSHLSLANVGGKVFALGGRVGDPAMTSDLIQVMRDDLSGWDNHEVKIPNGGFHNAAVAVYNE